MVRKPVFRRANYKGTGQTEHLYRSGLCSASLLLNAMSGFIVTKTKYYSSKLLLMLLII